MASGPKRGRGRGWRRRVNSLHEGRTQPSPRCGSTRKVIFATWEAAMERGSKLLESERWRSDCCRAYHCQFCGGYHLTHKP